MKNHHSHTFLFLLLVVIAAGSLAVFVREWNVRMMKPFIPSLETTYTPPAPAMVVNYAPTSTGTLLNAATTSTPAAAQNVFVSDDGVTHVSIESLNLMNPFTFSGTTTAFENQASWKLTQKGGKVLGQGYFYVHSPDAGIPGPFSVMGFYDALPTNASGTLLVYEASAKDGTPIHSVSIPVTLEVADKTNTAIKATVYFANTTKDPNMTDCSKVYPVTRKVLDDEGDFNIVMHELLKGPTAAEKKLGYISLLPDNVSQPTFPSSDHMDFDTSLSAGVAGSCRVSAIRAQLEQTYQAFYGSSTTPIISVNGNASEALQP